jgi:AcrR family transcriptional regulator
VNVRPGGPRRAGIDPGGAARLRILEAASALFVRRGYVGTTVQAVAGRAGVSVQTIYNVVGGKSDLLKAVYDAMLAGDAAPVPMSERPTAKAMRAATDARTCLVLYARMPREIFERVGPLLSAVFSDGDPDVRRFLDVIDGERANGTRQIAGFIAARFGMRPGMSTDQAADILWTLTSVDVAYRLVRRRRWSLTEYERWLGRTMADALLGDQEP